MRLLTVYNICGLGNAQKPHWYIHCLESILRQEGIKQDVVVSSCCSSEGCITALRQGIDTRVSYNLISDKLPLGITFNHTVEECVRRFGGYDGYLYIDSGVSFSNSGMVKKLWEFFLKDSVGIAASYPVNDSGEDLWDLKLELNKEYQIPPGKAVNMHCQIFSNEIREKYGRLLPDVFSSDCSESVTPYLCSAIDLKFMLTTKTRIDHDCGVDGPSAGFQGVIIDPRTYSRDYFQNSSGHRPEKIIYDLGKEYGYGFEEWNPGFGWIHDPSKFSSEGFSLDPRLYVFLKQNLYLRDNEFDYSKINFEFIPKKTN